MHPNYPNVLPAHELFEGDRVVRRSAAQASAIPKTMSVEIRRPPRQKMVRLYRLVTLTPTKPEFLASYLSTGTDRTCV